MVVHSRAQDQRRQQRLARALEASWRTRESTVGEAAKPAYCWHAAAAAAAAKRRARQSASHQVAVRVEERPQDGPGRPRHQQPRVVKALRYGRQVTLQARAEVIARQTQEPGGGVLLTHVPTAGEMAHRAGAVRRAYQEPHGIEPNVGCLKAPLRGNSLFLKQPERIAAVGLV